MCKILKFILLAIIISGIELTAQEIKIKIKGSTKLAYILQLQGEKESLVDSVIPKNFIYQFNLIGETKGIYRLRINSDQTINFILDNADVSIVTTQNYIYDSLKVLESESNKLYYKLLEQNKKYKTKTDLLYLVLENYPIDDDYYKTTRDKLVELQINYSNLIGEALLGDHDSFIACYIASSQLPIIPEQVPMYEHSGYLKEHALEKVDFNDDELIYSDLFTNKSIEYLSYYRNPQLPKELLEKEFMKAIDILLVKARVNDVVYKHIIEYLIDGFTKFGFDNIIDYIVTNYVMVDDLCLDEGNGNSIQNRVNQAKFLKVGDIVPNIIIPDTSGQSIDLSEIKSEKILILFYASWCPHCQTLIPQIKELYDNSSRNDFEVLAVSLDTNKLEWTGFIEENKLNWLNASDLKGWDSEVAELFFIYATPTMFLIDNENKIVSKPLTMKELIQLK